MAEATKHTPGKWTVGEQLKDCVFSGKRLICDLEKSDIVFAECEANAALISAAPELLECLQETLSLVELLAPYVTDTLKNSRAAIAKATGA